jgi:oligopeptide transport system substrate-binding protein
VPLERLAAKIPWLPLEQSYKPATFFMGFLTSEEPFRNTQVRRAFALAVDRHKLIGLTEGTRYANSVTATSFIPAEVLGRDLNNEIGLSYNPNKARTLLAEAGYPDGAGFPPVTLGFLNGSEEQKIAETLAGMWKETLGVNIQFKPVAKNQYLGFLSNSPPNLYLLGWAADYMDPNNFMKDLFRDANFGKFREAKFEALVQQAEEAVADPALRQLLYIQAERLLCDKEAGVVPLYHYQATK